MYSLSSTSQIREPRPRTMYGGSPPTALNARTGESTPPGITREARRCKSLLLLVVLDEIGMRFQYIALSTQHSAASMKSNDRIIGASGHRRSVQLPSDHPIARSPDSLAFPAVVCRALPLSLYRQPMPSCNSEHIN